MKNITVIGVGYVGLVTGACFADLGNRVVCLDINAERIERLKQGIMPIYEPGLEELVERNVRAQRLFFTTSYAEALREAEFAFIAVGTPEGVDGEADLRYVRMAAESIADVLDHPIIIVNKSTVPVGTGDWVADIIRARRGDGPEFAVVSCPEFLREGSAISDFMNPDRVVLGSLNREAAEKVAQLHLPLRTTIMITDLRTAEMIKYASNAFLATRISFINEIANICEAVGADVKEVATGMGYDRRIGRGFLDAGLGYGGSCFEGDETVFILNSPTVAGEPLRQIFAESGQPFQGDVVQVAQPGSRQVVAFDLATGRPMLAEVTAVTRRPYAGTMVRIVTSMGRALRLTADHPVILQADDGFRVVPAAAVQPGDQLPTLCDLPALEPVDSLNLVELLRDTPLEADVHVSPVDDSFTRLYPQFAPHIPPEILRHPVKIRRHNRMPLRLFRHLTTLGVLDVPAERLQLHTARGTATKINGVIPVDKDWMRLLGYYLAEGFVSQDVGRAGALRERVGFTFHEDERESIADMEQILLRLGLRFSERRSGSNSLSVVVSSRVFAWLIRDVLRCGTRSDNKALPRLAFNVPEALRHELLRGVFSGDGAVTLVQRGGNLMLEYATVSKSLADGLAFLMQTLGIVPSLRQRWMNKSRQVAYVLRVSGYGQLAALQDLFGEQQRTRIATVLSGYQRHIRQRGFTRQGSYALLTVRRVEHEQVETEVYSLETSSGTLIASSGLICHNCFPKDVKALAHMAATHGRPPRLLNAVMEINAGQRRQVVSKLREALGTLQGTTIGLLGLAFKPNTDDMREAPSVAIAQALLAEGAHVRAYDPVAMENARRMLPDVEMASDPYTLAEGCDALVVVTEWNEFKNLNLQQVRDQMRRPVLIDGRNIYDPETTRALGFIYIGMGRGFNKSNADDTKR